MAKMEIKIRIAAFRRDFLNAVTVHLRSGSFNRLADVGKISVIWAIVNRLKRSLSGKRGFLKEAMQREGARALGDG
jgi:hypothetical protein